MQAYMTMIMPIVIMQILTAEPAVLTCKFLESLLRVHNPRLLSAAQEMLPAGLDGHGQNLLEPMRGQFLPRELGAVLLHARAASVVGWAQF